MAGKSTYLENAVLNWIKGAAMPAAPAGVYVGLFSADPTDAGSTANEVTATVRAAGRVPASFGAIAGKQIANTAVVDFGNAAATATVSHIGLFDAASGGNMLYSAAIGGGAQTVNATNPVTFPVGTLTVGEE